jgi:hypothetical protein
MSFIDIVSWGLEIQERQALALRAKLLKMMMKP